VLSEVDRLARLVVKHPRDAFGGPAVIDSQWRDLGFTGPPDFARAIDEYDRFLTLIGQSGAEILSLPKGEGVGLDSLYARDASIVCDRGVILCAMGKPLRAGEPSAQGVAFREWGLPVAGSIEPPGTLEGGDVVWLDPRTIAVGRGYRTNDDGVRQLRALLGDSIDELIEVPLPHWRGPGDVFHLMSVISPVADDVAVVYSPLMPVPFRERLVARGIHLVEVPDEEFDSMGANVLAIAPRHAVMVAGNPRTRARLEAADVRVDEYPGHEISLKGGGGPTCLTRPIARVSS
jgi:N-dimethylarginine dimethylaminohydrolase